MDKQQLWEKIEHQKEDLVRLCCDMIQIPSENPPCNVEEICSYICRYLDEAGIAYEVVRPKPNLPNILARFGNPQGKTLVFNGHMDVVPAGDLEQWDFPPYCGEVRDGKILGRGTSDMKCGLAASLFTMALLAKEQANLTGQILMTIVPDEESGGFYGTRWLFEQGLIKGDWGIVAEPTGYDNIEVGQKGSLCVTVRAKGASAHGSLSPYVGDNAVEKLMRFLLELRALRQLHGNHTGEMARVMEVSKQVIRDVQKAPGVENCMDHVTVNFGTFHGGIRRNVVADYAEADVDVRIPLGVHFDEVAGMIEQIQKQPGMEGITVEYSGARSGNWVSVESPICRAAQNCAKELMGIDLVMAYQWASSDTRYFRDAGIQTIQYGPSDTEGIHSYNETVTIKDVVNAAKMYTGIIWDLMGSDK